MPAWIPSRHCERLQGAWQSSKNNKNLNLAFLTGLLRQNLQFFLAMT
ncbi:transglycosylase SLT family domain protein, partial [Rickettsia amblyommatis str. Darkwater]